MSELHLIRPYFLLAIIPLIIVLLILIKRSPSKNHWQAVCDPHLIKSLMTQVGKNYQRLTLVLIFISGLVMVIALAGPSFQKLPQASYAKKQATVIVLDMSSEMNAKDIKPSRLQRAKFKIDDLLKNMPEGQIGLIAFTQEAFLVSPLTNDQHTLKLLLNELTPQIMPVDGSNISSALNQAAKLIKQANYTAGNILVLTANKANSTDLQTAKKLAKDNFHTSILGMATALGAPLYDSYQLKHISKLDVKSLDNLASAGKGKFITFSSTDKDINKIISFFKNETSNYKKQQQNLSTWQDEGRILILLLLPLVLLAFRRGFLEGLQS